MPRQIEERWEDGLGVVRYESSSQSEGVLTPLTHKRGVVRCVPKALTPLTLKEGVVRYVPKTLTPLTLIQEEERALTHGHIYFQVMTASGVFSFIILLALGNHLCSRLLFVVNILYCSGSNALIISQVFFALLSIVMFSGVILNFSCSCSAIFLSSSLQLINLSALFSTVCRFFF